MLTVQKYELRTDIITLCDNRADTGFWKEGGPGNC